MSTEAETTSATATVTTPTKVAPGTGSAPGTPSKETDEARTQLVQGRRHLLVKDYFSAVASLAKGCELLAKQYGDTAPELGDAYLTYGRALLELARSESGVLGMNEDGEDGEADEDEEADDGEGEEDGEEEDEKKEGVVEEEKKEGGEEKEVEGAKKDDNEKENGEKKENGEEAAKQVDKEAVTNGSAETNGKSEANGTGDKKEVNGDADSEKNGIEKEVDVDQTLKEEDEEDDVNNLQLAWEILELAKGIFQKQLEAEGDSGLKQNSLKLAEVHLKLGEVGVESENYNTAVEDMKACLEIQKKYLEDDDRRIAETLYTLGMAYSLANEFDSAIEQFKLASEQIEKRIASLEKRRTEPTSGNKEASDDPFYTVEGEIKELKDLLPEIKEKVSDMQDFKKETIRRMMDGLAEASVKQSSTADGAGPSSATDKPVSNVAHLVKRKPKEDNQVSQSTEKSEKPEDKSVEVEDKSGSNIQDATSERKRKPDDGLDEQDTSKKPKVDDSDVSATKTEC